MGSLISSFSSFGHPVVELYYGGNRLYPAPLIDFSRNLTRNAADVLIAQEDTYTLKGLYLNSPSGFYHVSVSGMNTLRDIFALDGLELVIKAGAANSALPSGTYIVSGIYPRVVSVGIPSREDQNFRFDYEVVLSSKTAASGVSGVVSSSNDSWDISENTEDGSTRLTHRVSAVGINTTSGSTSNAVTNAKNYVNSKIGLSGLNSLPAFCSPPSGFSTNYRIYELTRNRSESFDNDGGTYEVQEVYILISGILPYTNARTFEFNRSQDGIITVNIQGTVQGAGRTDGTNTAFNAFNLAQSGYLASVQPNFANDASGVYLAYGGSGILNIGNPTSKSITENKFLGTVGYAVTFSDDPSLNLPSGIADQSLSIQRKDPIPLIVSHVIPQRRISNILQYIGTPTEGTININVNIKAISTGNPVADTNTALAYAQLLINQNRPNPSDFITLRLEDVSYNPDKLKLTVSASVTWVFTTDITMAQAADSDIIFNPVT